MVSSCIHEHNTYSLFAWVDAIIRVIFRVTYSVCVQVVYYKWYFVIRGTYSLLLCNAAKTQLESAGKRSQTGGPGMYYCNYIYRFVYENKLLSLFIFKNQWRKNRLESKSKFYYMNRQSTIINY